MTHLRNFLLFCFIGLIPIQDSYFRLTPLKEFGASLSVFPLLGLIVISLIRWIYSPALSVKRLPVFLFVIAMGINAIALIRFGGTVLDVNVVAKTFAASILSIFWIYVVFGIDYSSFPYLRQALTVALFITALGALFGDLHFAGLAGLVNNPLFHATDNPDPRWRSFASESSSYSALVVCLGLSATQYTFSRVGRILLLTATVALLVFSRSKGGVMGLGIAYCLFLMIQRHTFKRTLVYISLALPVGIFAAFQLTALTTATILTETTTLATRLTMVLWALIAVVHNPLGAGVAGFYACLSKYSNPAMDLARNLSFVPLNFSEVRSYAVSGQNATTKILSLDYLVEFGLPFLVMFVWWSRGLIGRLRHCNAPYLLTSVLFVLVALCTYLDSMTAYNLFLVLGLAANRVLYDANPSRSERFSISA